MKHGKSLKINTFLNIAKTCSSIAFPLITYPYVSRVLMPGNIGKVNFGTSYISYFSLIATLGVTTYAIRECSKNRDNKTELNKTASEIYSINICTTIVAYLLLALSLSIFKEVNPYRILIIIQSSTIFFTTIGADWINSAMEDFAYITIRTVAFQIISLALILLFVRTPEDYLVYAGIAVFSTSGANIANYFYRRKYCRIKFVCEMQWKKHFKPIFYLFVMILAQTVFNSADITMLGIIRNDYEVGLYSTAVKVSSLIAQIVASIAWVVMPRMSQYFAEGDYKKINSLLRKVLNVLLTIGIPCAIGAMCLSKEIIMIIAGDAYLGADHALYILMISFLISLIGGNFLGNMVLLPSQREKIYMIVCCIATIFNVIANYFLIPVWGINAAAGTTAVSALIILVLLLITLDRRIRFLDMIRVSIPPLVGAGFIILICNILRNLLDGMWIIIIACVVAASATYIGIQIIMKNEIIMEIINTLGKKNRRKY